jgi:HAD superfamily hydrolase (TIGR01509 family)
MIQSLIFDFDGLILDTETPLFRSWQEIFHKHGCDLSVEDWATSLDRSFEPVDPVACLERHLGYPVDRQAIHARRIQREFELLATERPLPGVEQMLAEAQKLRLKLAVASNSDRDWVTDHLTRLGLWARFDSILCADDGLRTKPDPALYLAALDELGVQADQAIAFEDSPGGILAAKRAHIYCVAVPNLVTRSLLMSQADVELTSLAELPLKQLLDLAGQRPITSTAGDYRPCCARGEQDDNADGHYAR